MNKTLIVVASLLTAATAISSVHAAGLGQSVNTLRPLVETVAAPENSRQMADAIWKDHNAPAQQVTAPENSRQMADAIWKDHNAPAQQVTAPENSRQMADAIWKHRVMPAIPLNLSDPSGGNFGIVAAIKPHIVKQHVAEFTHVKRPGFLTALGFVKVPRDPEIAGLEQMAKHDARVRAAASASTGGGLVLVSSGSEDNGVVNATWNVYEGKAKDGSYIQLVEYASVPDRDVLARDMAGSSSSVYFQELSKIDAGEKTPVSQ